MILARRTFLTGLAGIIASGCAPAIVKAAHIMPVKPVQLIIPGETGLIGQLKWDKTGKVMGVWNGTRYSSAREFRFVPEVRDMIRERVKFEREMDEVATMTYEIQPGRYVTMPLNNDKRVGTVRAYEAWPNDMNARFFKSKHYDSETDL